MGTQKGKLFELAEMYHTYQRKNIKDKKRTKEKKSVEVKCKHFDEGKSISLAYSLEMYPEVLYESYERNAPVTEMSLWDDRSEAFYVEPFESDETVDVDYGTYDEDEEKLDKVVQGFSTDAQEEFMDQIETEESEAFQHEGKNIGDLEKLLNKVVEPKKEATAAEPSVLEEKIGKKEIPPQAARENIDAPPMANKEPVEISDEEFVRDIGAILKGQKVYDADQKKAVAREGANLPQTLRPETSQPAANTPGPKDNVPDTAKNENKIFEKIAKSMQYANSYDLGAIALDERFEKMEKEIEQEELNKITRTRSSSPETRDDIQYADVMEDNPLKRKEPAKPEVTFGEKYNPKVPLDNNNGGRLIKADQLQKGDLILASSSGGVFNTMEGPQASDSIAGIYTGNDKLLTKGDGGALEEKQLQPHITNRGVMVVLRHQSISAEKATIIVESLTKLRVGPEKTQGESWVKISSPMISIHADACNAADDKTKCNAFAGKIYLGTANNDSFACAQSVINAFENNQLSFVSLLTKEHNGSLKYFGHLKNKP
jgi:hypothetical protein